MKKLKKTDAETIRRYEVDLYEQVHAKTKILCEMDVEERKLLNGLVRYFKPKRILELGIARGGGTVVMLNALQDMPQSTVTSIDVLDHYYREPEKPVGFFINVFYAGGNAQSTVIGGKDPAEVMESLGTTFDFLMLDTAHTHPVETLNFLTVLPYLSKNAVVVIHDISLFATTPNYSMFPNTPLACRLLYDAIVGDKMKLWDEAYLQNVSGFSNIGVVQLNQDTRKYIGNVFSLLEFPWGMKAAPLETVRNSIAAHYAAEHVKVLDNAIKKYQPLA